MNRRWPAAIALWAALWYASDSLRHRREGGRGYTIDDPPEVGGEGFLRAAESLTQAPISRGNEIELLINGDRIFPASSRRSASARADVEPAHLRLLAGRYRRGGGRGRLRARRAPG